LLLYTAAFDGFKTTRGLGAIETALAAEVERGIWTVTLGLFAFPLLFIIIFLLTRRLIVLMGGSAQTIVRLAGKFITTLMPISIAYHLVRSLSFLLINTQFFILLASNLFGFGWGLLSPRFARSSPNIRALAEIVIGHTIAIERANSVALKIHSDSWRATRSEYPMLLLMVGYTVVGL